MITLLLRLLYRLSGGPRATANAGEAVHNDGTHVRDRREAREAVEQAVRDANVPVPPGESVGPRR
jgi:hypothetical protein